MTDQNEAERWAPGGGYAQVSVFFSESAEVTQDNLKELAYNVREGLEEDSVAVSEEESARGLLDAFSTTGALTVEHEGQSLDVDAVGIGGDFFSFHPLELVSGGYFDGDDLMKDRILIDEDLAWKLFGSSDVVGQSVLIGDMNHFIAGVYRREKGMFYETAGLDRSTVFVAYKTMLQYGTRKTFSGGDSADETTENAYVAHGYTEYDTAAAAETPVWERHADAGPAGISVTSTAGDYSTPGDGGFDMPGSDGPGSDGPGGYEPGGYEPPDVYEPDEIDDPDVSEGSFGSVGADPTGGTVDSTAAEDTAADSTGADAADAAGGTAVQALPEGIGTQNTAYSDNGKVMCYEIVLPDPVDGYAEKLVRSRIGLGEGDYAVVENSGRYEGMALSGGWLNFWTRSMRIGNVSYPFWENAARGWEDILSVLFLFQCLLTALPALYVLYLILYYFTHKQWTLLGIVREMQDRAYEREAARRYPELVRQLEAERLAMKGEA